MQVENYYLYNSYDTIFAIDRKIVAKFTDFLELVRNENALADARIHLMEIAGIEGSHLPTGRPWGAPVDDIDLICREDLRPYMPTAPPPAAPSGTPADPVVIGEDDDDEDDDDEDDDDDDRSPELKRPKRTPLPRGKPKKGGK
jgi:hypothetical protein